MRRQKRASCTKSVINKKMANLGNKDKFRRQKKWRVCQKLIKSLAKYSNQMTKRGMLTAGDF